MAFLDKYIAYFDEKGDKITKMDELLLRLKDEYSANLSQKGNTI